MKKKILLLIFVLVSLLCITIPSQAAAENPVINERDTEIFGLLPRKQNDSLNWKSLDLKCSVHDASDDNHFYKTINEAKSTYQIENTDWGRTVKEELVLPYFEIENSLNFKQQKTSIVVDGEKVTPKLRHASAISGMEYYYNKEIPLYENYIANGRLSTNTSVHKITAKADVSNLKDNASYQYVVNVKRADGSLLVAKNLKSLSKNEEDNFTLTFSVNKNSSSFELYFIGGMSEFSIENEENLTIEETDGNLLSFANFQLPENISLVDWFNMIIQRLTDLDATYSNRGLIPFEELMSTFNVMSFLVFSVNFESFRTVTIEITTPFYALGNDTIFHFSGCFLKGISHIYVSVSGGYTLTNFIGGEQELGGYLLKGFEFQAILDSTLINTVKDIGLMIVGGILTFFLYFIPMAIMLFLFIRRRDKKNLIVLYIQKFLAYSLGFFGLLFTIISDSDLAAGITLLCLFGILTIITLIQNIKNNCRDFGRLALETLCWVLIIYNVSFGDIFVIFTALMIFCFIEFIFITSKIRKMKSIDPTLPKKCLPVGILYPVESWLIYAYFAIMCSVSYIISEVINQMWFFFIALIIIFIGYYIGMLLRLRFFFIKPFRKFYKDLDLDALEQSIQKRQALPNVHPETINLYNIFMVKHSLIHSKEKGREYFKKCYLPKTKGYLLNYRGLLLRYGLTKEEFDHSYEVLKKEYYSNKHALKHIDKFYKFWSPYYGINPTDDISKIYKVDHKNNAYSNAISLFLLIYYYKNQKNTSKVRELKYEFLKKYSVLTEFVNDLNEL